jgi:hypothetical protein
VVRPASSEDALWSADQALRSGACGAALFWLPGQTDYAWLRRLQMAAEAGRTLAVLFRPTSAASLATPAHLRVLVTPGEGHVLVSLPKRRGPPLIRPVAVRIACHPAHGPGSRLRGEGPRGHPFREGSSPASPLPATQSIARHAERASA